MLGHRHQAEALAGDEPLAGLVPAYPRDCWIGRAPAMYLMLSNGSGRLSARLHSWRSVPGRSPR